MKTMKNRARSSVRGVSRAISRSNRRNEENIWGTIASYANELAPVAGPLLAAIGQTAPPLPAKLTPLHFDHQGGLMEQSNASLQRGHQG